jgi:cytochrome c-type biogenesis protein CcmH
MFGFWLIAALLLLMSLAVIIIILLKTHDQNDDFQEDNKTLYQQHLAEIELDMQNGLLEGNEAKKIKQELQLTLLNEVESIQKPKLKNTSSASTITAMILLTLIPVFVISLYSHLGQPQLIKQAELLAEFRHAETQEEKLASVEKMLEQLEQRLINHPDDIDGWLMLTNSYTAIERYPDALKAVNNLYRLRGDDPTVMLRYADILAMNNDGIYAGRPTDLINDALKIDPENPNGLWFAGLAANERGDINEAIQHWQKLVPKLEEGSEQQQQVKQFIQMISLQSDTYKDEALTELKNQKFQIQINVSLSEELTSETGSDDTVFIYAQAVTGPPMPIAVVRKKVSDLPLEVTLDDSMAMMPNNKLSNHQKVKLTARISKSGNAIAESGDLIGTVNNVQTSLNEAININISQKIP